MPHTKVWGIFLAMRTIKVVFSYDGTRYAGWQRQSRRAAVAGLGGGTAPRFRTVQEEAEKALEKIVGHQVHLVGSGRTDAGVHAVAQPAHFTTTSTIPASRLLRALDHYLPEDIGVVDVREADRRFHARFSAKSKAYRYVIVPACEKTVFLERFVFAVKYPLSIALMRRAARCLVGRHDFSSFKASDRVLRKSVTRIEKIRVFRRKGEDSLPFLKNEELIIVDIEASGFLRGMVRNIVGTLIDIGRGRLAPDAMEGILKRRDRRHAGFCAPARGLYLRSVRYA
jgi:tRNA pseudouridine38-40 synthase